MVTRHKSFELLKLVLFAQELAFRHDWGSTRYVYIYIYVYIHIIFILVFWILWTCVSSICLHKPHSAAVPGRFWYIFLTAQFAEQTGDAHPKPRRSTHTHIIYIYTPCEPWKHSFLGLSAHISRAEKPSFFMGFGVHKAYTGWDLVCLWAVSPFKTQSQKFQPRQGSSSSSR